MYLNKLLVIIEIQLKLRTHEKILTEYENSCYMITKLILKKHEILAKGQGWKPSQVYLHIRLMICIILLQ